MNEKERLQLEEELLMTCSKAQAINKYIDELEENQQLKERIDKAICYVQENTCWELRTSKLLDILKEVSE